MQIYNTISKSWELPILLSKQFYAEYMICKKEIIFFLGRKDNNDGLIIMYKNETFEYAPLNMKFGFDASIVVVDNYVYVFGNGNTSEKKN